MHGLKWPINSRRIVPVGVVLVGADEDALDERAIDPPAAYTALLDEVDELRNIAPQH